jgi:hypothetical protein
MKRQHRQYLGPASACSENCDRTPLMNFWQGLIIGILVGTPLGMAIAIAMVPITK